MFLSHYEVIREFLINFHADLQGTIDHNNEAFVAGGISTKSNAQFNNVKCCIRLRSLALSLDTPYKPVPRGILPRGLEVYTFSSLLESSRYNLQVNSHSCM